MKAAALRSLGAGIAGFVVYGGWAWYANMEHGATASMRAGVLQGSYSLVLTFASTLMMEALYARFAPRSSARQLTIGATALILLAVPITLHMFAGTPEILMTVLPGFAIGMVYTTVYVNALARLAGPKTADR